MFCELLFCLDIRLSSRNKALRNTEFSLCSSLLLLHVCVLFSFPFLDNPLPSFFSSFITTYVFFYCNTFFFFYWNTSYVNKIFYTLTRYITLNTKGQGMSPPTKNISIWGELKHLFKICTGMPIRTHLQFRFPDRISFCKCFHFFTLFSLWFQIGH